MNEERANSEFLQLDQRELHGRVCESIRSVVTGVHERFDRWTRAEQTRAEVETFVLDQLYVTLPRPPFTEEETQQAATKIYEYLWERSSSDVPLAASA